MERDDIIEYSLDAHHSEEEGKKIRKKIWMVTLILTVVTTVEVVMGIFLSKTVVGADSGAWTAIKLAYIGLTLLKAGYIVMVFMHLGDERKWLRYLIIAPYIGFICYLLFILFGEASWITMG